MPRASKALKLVILESPFSPANGYTTAENISYGRAALRDSLSRGEAPLASHLLYTQDGVLDDEIAAERNKGIAAGLAWVPHAALMVVYVDRGLSAGMQAGIAKAVATGVSVEFRRIDPPAPGGE